MLSRLVITFFPRSKRLLISWLQSPSAVILEPKRIKSDTVSTVSPSISHEVMGPDAMILVFWMLSFKLTFSFSFFTFINRLFSSSLPPAKKKKRGKKLTFTSCCSIDLWSLRLREASPNVFGHKWSEWDRTLPPTESSCLPLRDARLPFPPAQGPPPTVEVCLRPPWGTTHSQWRFD